MERAKPLFAAATILSVLVGSLAIGAAMTWRPAWPSRDMAQVAPAQPDAAAGFSDANAAVTVRGRS